ncbi:DUF1127 domain-containing protein [Yoonia sp. I 8.24]|uniref:DUF1127 domain-containing protein n=1 Tax=Yoonia sp. I 8.24 TaxID=1537229 RepID=UPI001EDD8142|nr:DUF1127 domain-containing protein [Yoonia sp. I 8.24]MCG3267437.1 DUF1127 domain-containing protein [Yoonia sp. I 8.24]
MAFFTDTAAAQSQPGILSKIGSGFVAAMTRIMDAQDRSPEVRRLEALSDSELAEMGIKRDDIIRHVFRDVYGL